MEYTPFSDIGMSLREEEVKETRKKMNDLGVEERRMEVDPLDRPGVITRAGWDKIRGMISGKRIYMEKDTGSVMVRGLDTEVGDGSVEIRAEDWVAEGHCDIEVSETEAACEDDRDSVRTDRSRKFSFLSKIEDDKRDAVLDSKIAEKRKRGQIEEETVRLRTLTGGEKWDKRESAIKDDGRWERVFVESGYVGDEVVEIERVERIPLPDSYKLGLEKKGVDMNNSDRPVSNFGVGKWPIFVNGGRDESKNWISSFHRGGCTSCVGESGERLHQGRNSKPVVLLVGDEAMPVTCGVTLEQGVEACCWVFKGEHLGLEEVAGVLRRLNTGKQEYDKKGGRKPHSFFLPPGSKVLVSSYVHLRKAGLQGYIDDYNKMVKEVWAVTGDVGVEVLPVMPVVYENLDELGRELLAGLSDWIGWVGKKAGRDSIGHLAETGGEDREKEICGRMVYNPRVIIQRERSGGAGGWRGGAKGMELVELGDRVREIEVRRVLPSTGLGRLDDGCMDGEKDSEEESERKIRESFENGVSMEGEFAFGKAVGEFLRQAVREGSYRGNYVLNLREQMEQRAARESREGGKVKAVVIGGSQMGRIGNEMIRVGGAVISEQRYIAVKGQLTDEEADRVIGELKGSGVRAEKVLVGGPSNSVLVHGRESERGHWPERSVNVVRGPNGEVTRMETRYHMTEPSRITMMERGRLVKRTVSLLRRIREVTGARDITYVTMYPRHVTRCCSRKGHMSDGDCLTANSIRREVDQDIVEEIGEKLEGVRSVEWYTTLKLDMEPAVRELEKLAIVSEDGVHLSFSKNHTAAVFLCNRMQEMDMLDSDLESQCSSKRMRLE